MADQTHAQQLMALLGGSDDVLKKAQTEAFQALNEDKRELVGEQNIQRVMQGITQKMTQLRKLSGDIKIYLKGFQKSVERGEQIAERTKLKVFNATALIAYLMHTKDQPEYQVARKQAEVEQKIVHEQKMIENELRGLDIIDVGLTKLRSDIRHFILTKYKPLVKSIKESQNYVLSVVSRINSTGWHDKKHHENLVVWIGEAEKKVQAAEQLLAA